MIKLLLLFTVVPLAELWLLIEVGRRIGALPAVALVAATGFLGVLLARSQGLSVMRKLSHDLKQGIIPGEQLMDGACVLIGGAFLLAPGLLTDTLGLLLLIPYTRQSIKKGFTRYIKRRLQRGTLRLWWR